MFIQIPFERYMSTFYKRFKFIIEKLPFRLLKNEKISILEHKK